MLARTIAHIWDSCFPRKHPGCLQPLGRGPLPSLTRGSCSPSPTETQSTPGGPGRFLEEHTAWQLHARRKACRSERDSSSSRGLLEINPRAFCLGKKRMHYWGFYFLLLAPQNAWKKVWAHQQYAAACYTEQAALASTKARGWEPALGPGHLYNLMLLFQPRSSAPWGNTTELWSHQEPL